MSERWFTEQAGSDWLIRAERTEGMENFIADCGADHTGDAQSHAEQIVANHNACLGIEDPKTTVPELVKAGETILAGPVDEPQIDLTGDYRTGLHCGLEDRDITDRYDACDYGFENGVERVLEWAYGVVEAVLAKTGKT